MADGFGGPGTYSVSAVSTYSVTDPCAVASNSISIPGNGTSCNCGQGPIRLAGSSPSEEESKSAINSVIPNPATNSSKVHYSLAKGTENAEIIIIDLFGHALRSYKVDTQSEYIEIDCRELDDGIYFTTLVVDGKNTSTKKLMVIK